MPTDHRLWFVLLCAVTTVGSSSAVGGKEKPPPNILFLLADDWRSDTLGMVTPTVKTPHLDQLAAAGVRFTEARVTTSICNVSRASILTGQYMARHGLDRFGVRVNDWNATYPAILHNAGYYTGFVGKFGVGAAQPNDFDFVRSYEGVHWIKQPDGSEIHVTPKNLRDATEFLRDRPRDRPFCLSVSFFAAHAQDNAPQQYLPQPWSKPLYRDAIIPLSPAAEPSDFATLPPFLATEKNEGRVRWRKRFDTPEKYQTSMKNYYRLVSEVDDAIGKLLDQLKASGDYENTFIIFSGDNGYFHGEHGLADKWFPYDEALRVPLIVRDPALSKAEQGTIRDQLVSNIDIAPTLLTAAHLPVPPTMQGEPLQRYYAESPPPGRERFYYQHPVVLGVDRIPRSEAVIEKRWRYHYWPDFKFEELFDLAADPHQQRNLAALPDSREKLHEMQQKLRELRNAAQ